MLVTSDNAGSPSLDSGLTVNQLLVGAWLLAVVSAGSLIRLLDYTSDAGPAHLKVEHLIWAMCCVVTAVFSACCAVLVGVKSAEQRLSGSIQKQDEPDTSRGTD